MTSPIRRAAVELEDPHATNLVRRGGVTGRQQTGPAKDSSAPLATKVRHRDRECGFPTGLAVSSWLATQEQNTSLPRRPPAARRPAARFRSTHRHIYRGLTAHVERRLKGMNWNARFQSHLQWIVGLLEMTPQRQRGRRPSCRSRSQPSVPPRLQRTRKLVSAAMHRMSTAVKWCGDSGPAAIHICFEFRLR